MAISFLQDITLNNNEIQNVVIQRLGADPTGVEGKIIYNNATNTIKYYNGTSWINLDGVTGMTSFNFAGDSGSSSTISNGGTATVAGGSGLTSAGNGSGAVTLTLSEATSTTIGGIELFSNTDQSVAANSVTTTANRTYGLQLNSSGQAVVNVPWIDSSAGGEFTLAGDSGVDQTINDGDTVLISGGTGITTAGANTDKVIVTNSKPFDSINFAASTGSSSLVTNLGTLTIAAGTGITTTNNAEGTITIAATGSGSMSSFLAAGDTGSDQTITNGDKLIIAGGTNISTAASATDTVTVNLNSSIDIGTLTVSDTAQSSFAGQVTIPTTPSASTDAASKAYVDSATSAAILFQGGYNAATNTPDLDSSPSSSIKAGWAYVVTVAGDFFTEAVEVGDLLISQQDAPTTLANWVTVQNNVDLATVSTVGIGNVNIDGAGTKDGLALSYASGTATVGLDIGSLPAVSTLNTTSVAAFYDPDGSDNNVKVAASDIAANLNALTSKKLTTTRNTTHTFTHNLNTFDVMVQIYDTSSKETVYADVDRTSVNVVTATTAASASLTALIQKIG